MNESARWSSTSTVLWRRTAGDLIGALNFVLAGQGVDAVPVAAARSLLGAGARALIQRGYARAGGKSPRRKLDALFAHS